MELTTPVSSAEPPQAAERHPYASFVHAVEKPTRYLGGEYNQVVKDWSQVEVRFCLAFPDVYEIGMSHLGTKILYKHLNKDARIACERAFTPWIDMEAQLRSRELPVLSMESARPLRDFDVVGVSLQYEMTYSNVLTLLDLSGLALRAEDRTDEDPLIIAGGPTATHPEPLAPFIDLFFIGEGEEKLPELLLCYSRLRERGLSKHDALVELAKLGACYVPAFYDTAVDPASEMIYVSGAKPELAARGVPDRVGRALVEDINAYPFPDDFPVPYAEAIFDRVSVEIARGCTEGCRFCQAGMIYRPVRERDPEQIVDTVLQSIKKGGFDETSLTSLSTADYSCVSPLVKTLMQKLRDERVSLSVSSLRAYGLDEELLDEMRSVRATGLTFAPEAGTQRMRDVVNKNVGEKDLENTAERVFARGWERMKLYFMIGLPTEENEDVEGIVNTGVSALNVGRRHIGKRASVTVSVSSHVPKPHTPFQWAAMDTLPQIREKQALLEDTARRHCGIQLKYHDARVSYVEGIFARGDRRCADLLELAWKRGARFDGWDECLKMDLWLECIEELELPVELYLGTLPLDAKLCWDHIDVGLEDGFLAREYKKSLGSRLSPPCGKVARQLVHHTNVAEAQADTRRLVCYDCGVACDMSRMRGERIDFLERLGAFEPTRQRQDSEAGEGARPLQQDPTQAPLPPSKMTRQQACIQFTSAPETGVRVRLCYRKLGRAAFLGHLDLIRHLSRVFRRAGISLAYSRGFHPMPLMSFAPALGLGVESHGELVDVTLTEDIEPDSLVARLNAVCPEGLDFTAARHVIEGEPSLSKSIHAMELRATLPKEQFDRDRVSQGLSRALGDQPVFITRTRKGKRGKGPRRRDIDIRSFILDGNLREDAESWLLTLRVRTGPDGSVRPRELAQALLRDSSQPAPGTGEILANRQAEAPQTDGSAGVPHEPEIAVTWSRLALLRALDGDDAPLRYVPAMHAPPQPKATHTPAAAEGTPCPVIESTPAASASTIEAADTTQQPSIAGDRPPVAP